MTCNHLENEDLISEEVEQYDGAFAINGCCGGGCYVISGIKFCPFCGEKLAKSPKLD
jgi:hypothetical protein